MYPLHCYAGYPMPLKAGKYEICGLSASPDTVGTATEIALYDDETIPSGATFGNIIDAFEHGKRCFYYGKWAAGDSPACVFSEPIKTRYGISVYSTNIEGGSLCVYVR